MSTHDSDSLPDITLILPAYNEALRIAGTIAQAEDYFRIRQLSYEIIVPADGDDGTREIVAGLAQVNPRLSTLGTIERRGKGYGVRQAVRRARGAIIGYADADDKTPIEEFDKFRPWLDAGWDLVIGSRAIRGAQIEKPQPWYRRVGSHGFAVFMHTIVGLKEIEDTQCGFKFFQRAVAQDLFARQRVDGYMFDIEILYLAESRGYRIAQVPIRWRDDRDSRLQLVRGNIQNVLDVLRIRLDTR